MSDKKFIGRVEVKTTQYGELIKIGIPEKEYVLHIKNGWVNMLLKKSKEGKYYLEIDDWTPTKKDFQPTTPEPVDEIDTTGDLPF